ncbi:GspI family T2SS minor pseudopilin variant XcpV [Maricurvus nonylphenolicus]
MIKTGQRGFTLLEVLVALAIFAVCAATLLKQSGQATRQAHTLETRTLANWIAQNRLQALRLEPNNLRPGNQSQVSEYARRRWQVHTQTHTTSTPTLFRIVVTVTEETSTGDSASAPFSLSGFIGKH